MTMDSNGVEAAGVLAEHDLKTLLKDGAQAFDADSESEAEYETASDTPEDATESETEPDVDVLAKSMEKKETSVAVQTTTTTTIKTVAQKESDTEALYPSVRRLLLSRPELRALESDALYPTVRRLVLAVVRRAAPQTVVKVTLAVESPAVTPSAVETVATSTVVQHDVVSTSETSTRTEEHTKTEVTIEESIEVHAVTSNTETSSSVEATENAVVDKLTSSTSVAVEKTVDDAVVEKVEVDVAVESAVPAVAVDVVAKETVVAVTPETTSEVSDEKAAEQTSIDVPVQEAAKVSTADVTSEKVNEEGAEKSAAHAAAKSISEKIVAVEMTIDDEVEKSFAAKAKAIEDTAFDSEKVVTEAASEMPAAVEKIEPVVKTSFTEKTEIVVETEATEKTEVVVEVAATEKITDASDGAIVHVPVEEGVKSVTESAVASEVATERVIDAVKFSVAENAVATEASVDVVHVKGTSVDADHVESTHEEKVSVKDAAEKVVMEDLVDSFVESIATDIVEEKLYDTPAESTSVDAIEKMENVAPVKEESEEVVVDHAGTSIMVEAALNSVNTNATNVEKKVETTKVTGEDVTNTVKTAVKSTDNTAKAVLQSQNTDQDEAIVEVMTDIHVNGDLVAQTSDSLYPSVMKLVRVRTEAVPAPPTGNESLAVIAQKTDSLYPSVRRLVLSLDVNMAAVGNDVPPPALAATPVKPARKSFGLGSFLPKVPSILRKESHKKAVAEQHNSTASSRGSHHSDDNDGEQDGVSSLTEQPAKESTHVPLATRLRGLSIEASSIVRKFNGLRSSPSTGESPRNSIEGAPPLPQRRSLTSGNSSPTQEVEVETKVQRGACVATRFGTGTVLDIRDDGFYVVNLVPKGTAYLGEEMIVREIKSIVGERVKTRWGLATVEQYFVDEDMYSIALDWRWDDDHVWRMKATTKKFEKISRSMSIVQNTKARFFEGYSTFRESASSGYANVAAKLNTTHKRSPQLPPQLPPQHPPQLPPQHPLQQASQPLVQKKRSSSGNLGRALTPYGVCSVIEVRPDQLFVVETKCGATAYLNADSVKMLHRRTNFSTGDKVRTPYGNGEILAFRDEDEVYEVKLDVSSTIDSSIPVLFITDAQAEASLSLVAAPTTVNRRLSTIFNMTRNSVFSASATVKASATEKLNSLSSVKSKMTTMAAIKMTKVKFQKGERVITTFGSGFVEEVRPLERIYEVKLRRLNTRGHFHESALQAFPYERVTHFIVDGKTIPAPEMPKNLPEYKRRHIINEAVRQAREGLKGAQ